LKSRKTTVGAAPAGPAGGEEAMKPVFIQLQCAPGRTYAVADAIYALEIASELYSTSGEYDLLMKVYIESTEDIGKFINEKISSIPGIVRTLTTLTFRAF
jgi:DNA-binding Lrp family transcriptional regulator